jgi:uncharacterized protein YutE (UPF0331/DUF86 family)
VTDPDLVAKKLALVETYVAELRREVDLERLPTDVKERRFVEHTLQIAIQACLDVASHVVSDDRLGEPRTNHEMFTLLERAGWLDGQLAGTLRKMVGFRNILVHGYAVVDPAVVEAVVRTGLGDFDAFVTAMRARLPREG